MSKSRKSNTLLASTDVFAADLVGGRLLGFDRCEVPHIVHGAEDRSRPTDLSDVLVVGEKIQDLASHHEWEFLYDEEGTLSLSFVTTQGQTSTADESSVSWTLTSLPQLC